MKKSINKRICSKDELIRSETFAHKVLDASLNGIYIHDVKLGKNVFINTQYTTLTGYDFNDLKAMDKAQFFDLIHPDDRQRMDEHMEKLVSGINDMLEIEYRFKTKDGKWIWCLSYENVAARDEYGAASQILGTFLDITERKHANETLRKSETRFRELFETLTQGVVFQIPPEGEIVDANPAAEQLLGLSREQMLGRSPKDADWQIIDADAGRHNIDENPALMALRTGQIVRDRVLGIYHPQRKEHRWLHIDAIPQYGWGEEKPYMVCTLFTDITDRRKAEEALLLNHQELTEYSYALTHNLKAPLRAIHNYVDFLFEDLGDSFEGNPKKYLEGIRKAIIQSDKQFKDLETLYHIKNHLMNVEPFDMRELLEEIESTFNGTPAQILIITHQQWPVFRGEKFFVRQILNNLISNGFKFNHTDIKRVEIGWQPSTDNRIEIFVRDNGIGIEPQYHEQIFQLFQRLHTESQYEGTGIGLTIVKRAAQRIGGTLRVESAIGKGSTFYVILPSSIKEVNQHEGLYSKC